MQQQNIAVISEPGQGVKRDSLPATGYWLPEAPLPALKIIRAPSETVVVVADLSLPPEPRVEGFLRLLAGQHIAQEEIAQRTGLTRRGVQGIIARLRRTCGVISTAAKRGQPASYRFAESFAETCAPCAALFDDPKPQCAAPEFPTSTSVPARSRPAQLTISHNSQDILPMGHGFNTHGRSTAKIGHGQKWNFTPQLLRDDAKLQAVADDYAAMGWIAANETGGAGEPGLVIIFEAAEHALCSIGAKGRSKARSAGAIFIARVRDHRQQKFKPITQATEDRARLRLKRLLYGEQPITRQHDEEEIL